MKVIGFNGSPRKGGNTATLLGKALEGAASRSAETRLVHLYDLKFFGCRSCFACKKRDGRSYGKCATRDALTPVLDEVAQADAIVLGSPIYLGTVTGQMRSFMERLIYPFLMYDVPTFSTLFSRKIRTVFIYTMNTTEQRVEERGYRPHIEGNAAYLPQIFGACETLCSFDTYQFDYARFVSLSFDPAHKEKRRQEVFPQDCEKAFKMGVSLTESLAA
jgi:multimeric flavodoxin WrbA